MKILGNSIQIKEINEVIQQVAPTDISVLITGESGTGKELVANSIHSFSKRKDKPFITVNCGAIPEGIIESELFGHQKGAFTVQLNHVQDILKWRIKVLYSLMKSAICPLPLR